MRYATWLGFLLFFAAIFATKSWASDADLVIATCSRGAVTVTAKTPWHTNPKAPWAWDKGSVVSKDQTQVKFKGPKCEGTVKAFIANGDQVKGPILVPIK
jgi:hypothetical protein